MSKMTIQNETEDAKRYEVLFFVEFLEFLARASIYKLKDSELESIPLC